MKIAASFAAMAIVLAAPAFAQDTQSSDTTVQSQAASDVLAPIKDDDAPVPQLNLMVGQVEDMELIGPDGGEIGDIENILGNQSGAQAITVDVGGFLGLGEKTVIIMIDDLTLDMGRVRTAMTKDEIESLPAFDD